MIKRNGNISCWESSSSARCAWSALNRDLAPHTIMVNNDTEWLAAFSTATRVPRTFGLLLKDTWLSRQKLGCSLPSVNVLSSLLFWKYKKRWKRWTPKSATIELHMVPNFERTSQFDKSKKEKTAVSPPVPKYVPINESHKSFIGYKTPAYSSNMIDTRSDASNYAQLHALDSKIGKE